MSFTSVSVSRKQLIKKLVYTSLICGGASSWQITVTTSSSVSRAWHLISELTFLPSVNRESSFTSSTQCSTKSVFGRAMGAVSRRSPSRKKNFCPRSRMSLASAALSMSSTAGSLPAGPNRS